jgi:hypothetical protein
LLFTSRFQLRKSPVQTLAEKKTTCWNTTWVIWCGPKCQVTLGGLAWFLPIHSFTAIPNLKVLPFSCCSVFLFCT